MNINKYLQISLISFLTILLIGQFALPVFAVDQPRFNIFTPYVHTQTYGHDYYLLDLRNETKGTDWNDPISADPGDIVMMSVYYHNAVNNTTAHNTKLRVALASGQSTSLVSTAYLWADNAENATYANPFTETGTINVSSSQRLEYISGSAKWYPDQKDWRVDSPTPFPFGQTGDEIIGSGVNIGDIIGCWEFSGYVNFKVRITSTAPTNPDLNIYKTVRNISRGESDFRESTDARPDDQVAFQLRIESVTNAEVRNVNVSDALPYNLSYISGSTRIDGNSTSDGITSGGINIGSLAGRQTKSITFEVRVAQESYFSYGLNTLTNYGYVRGDNISQRSDTAQVLVRRETQPTGDLSIYKTARNITRGESSWSKVITAKPGEQVAFSLRIESISNSTIYNIIVSDALPYQLSYISGSTRIDGSYTSDGITRGGINLGSFYARQVKTITFEATIASETSFVFGTNVLTNYGYVRADNISQRNDTAQVNVERAGQDNRPNINFRKTVQNLTSPNGTDTYNTASAGHILKYTLIYQNVGNLALTNVSITDDLPSYVDFVSADSGGSYDSSSRRITWNIGSIIADGSRSGSVSYQVKVQNVTNPITISNTALITTNEIPNTTSNEVRTDVGVVQGKVITVVTGADNNLFQKAITSLAISLMALVAIYLVMQNLGYFTELRLKFNVLGIRLKSKLF